MKTIKLYSILFEQEEMKIDIGTDLAASVTDIVNKALKPVENRLEKKEKEVPTTSLSTTGTKPASGTGESRTDKKIDDIEDKITKTADSNRELKNTIENIKSTVNSLANAQREKK
jgi:predicted  nucleic acid-binding Zn-ribbon protein